MGVRRALTLAGLLFAAAGLGAISISAGAAAGVTPTAVGLKVHAAPPSEGRVSPMLYGGFVELLDDLAPGMWAEMLGDRGFEGVLPTSTWDYFRGEPDLCDRDWDQGPDWGYDTTAPFNDRQSARLEVGAGGAARLTQSGLAVRKGMGYKVSGHWRGDSPSLRVRLSLKTLLPDGTWLTLAALDLPRPGREWGAFAGELRSNGTTDRAVFEVEARGSGHLWLDQLSLMPDDNVDGWRRDVVEAMKELAPPVVRWGGSTVDPGPYRWSDAVGERDRRPSFVNRVWGRRDTNDVGVEEFVRLCRAVGRRAARLRQPGRRGRERPPHGRVPQRSVRLGVGEKAGRERTRRALRRQVLAGRERDRRAGLRQEPGGVRPGRAGRRPGRGRPVVLPDEGDRRRRRPGHRHRLPALLPGGPRRRRRRPPQDRGLDQGIGRARPAPNRRHRVEHRRRQLGPRPRQAQHARLRSFRGAASSTSSTGTRRSWPWPAGRT